MIRLATVFSGIGAIEHAFQRLNIDHKIVFACDNGGINIFSKDINDTFLEIKNEIKYLKGHIENLAIHGFEEYINKLNTDLSLLTNSFDELEKNIKLKEINFEEIIINLNRAFQILDSNNINIFNEYKLLEDHDPSIILILVNEVQKYLSKIDITNLLELTKIRLFLLDVTKNKEYRKIRREIKEIPKKLSEFHSTIKTLEVLSELNKISNPREKKKFVDSIYSIKEKSNFVKKAYIENYRIASEDFHWNISFLDGNEYKDKVDLFVGGSPCQSFSMVGKRKGFEDTRGTLFYEFVRLLNEISPRFFIYENVQGVLSHDGGQTWEIMQNSFKEAGYEFKHYILNSRNFGIPQNRNRLFVIGFKNEDEIKIFKNPKTKELLCTMQDFLEDSFDAKYFLPEKGLKFVTDKKNLDKQYTQINGDIALCQKANQQFNWHGDFIECYTEDELKRLLKIDPKYFLSEKVKKYILSEEDSIIKPETDLKIARPLTATMHKMHRAGVDNYITYGEKLPVEKRKIRKLTPRECYRLMGFCDSFKIVVSDTQAYQQAGNSIVVDVLMAILIELNEVIKKS
ncbi:DNA cytosine methyltransferase [Cetobacterium sp.]|uniref:DNA cytosine methyltransferase n=1 Tax=Cetobacterium sp. TaxID=2071632 RepID=UPI003F397ED0